MYTHIILICRLKKPWDDIIQETENLVKKICADGGEKKIFLQFSGNRLLPAKWIQTVLLKKYTRIWTQIAKRLRSWAYKVNVIQTYSDWQYDCNHAAFFAAFQYFYLSVMLSDNFTDKCKPQAGTSHSTASWFVYTEERGEDFFLIFRRNADSGVGDFKKDVIDRGGCICYFFGRMDIYGYFSTGVIVFDRIFHKIVHSAIQQQIASGNNACLLYTSPSPRD